jgi:hypothetical protein
MRFAFSPSALSSRLPNHRSCRFISRHPVLLILLAIVRQQCARLWTASRCSKTASSKPATLFAFAVALPVCLTTTLTKTDLLPLLFPLWGIFLSVCCTQTSIPP